jgi:hypothetical protein
MKAPACLKLILSRRADKNCIKNHMPPGLDRAISTRSLADKPLRPRLKTIRHKTPNLVCGPQPFEVVSSARGSSWFDSNTRNAGCFVNR